VAGRKPAAKKAEAAPIEIVAAPIEVAVETEPAKKAARTPALPAAVKAGKAKNTSPDNA
jgi:hypothetical protein